MSDLPQEERVAGLRGIGGRWFERVARLVEPRLAYALIVILLLGLGALALRYHSAVKAELTDSVMARRAALAQLAAATLSERLDRMVDLGVSLATRVRFAELVAAGQWQAAAEILRKVPGEFRFVDRIFVADIHGTLMADVPEVQSVRGTNFAHRDWYQGVAREWKPYVSAVYRRSAEPQLNLIAVAAPIHERSTGRVAGILVAQLSLEAFFDWAKAIGLEQGARLFAVDAQGKAGYATGVSAQAPIADLSASPAVLRLREGRSGTEVAVPAGSGEARLYAFVPARHGWGIATEEPASAAFAARDLQLRFLEIAYALGALLLLTAAWLGMRNVKALRRTQRILASHAERLRILREVDRALLAQEAPEAIAAAVIQPLRELLGVPRAIVNRFDAAAGEVEWMAAAGRRRTRVGPGVRYPMRLMGDVEALRRGEPQRIDVHALPRGPEADALLASGVHAYMAVPMIAGGELIGAISFGGESAVFPPEQIAIAQEAATQLAIAIAQTRLHERVRRHAGELEQRVAERTSALDSAKRELEDLYNQAPCGYHSVDAEGRIVRMNDTWLSWLRYTREEVVGKMHHPDLMTPASAEKFWKQAFPLFRRQGWLKDTEFEYRRKDGSRFPAVLNATSIHDEAGCYVMSRSTVFDVSDRKRAEQSIRESEQELRMLHDATLEISKAPGSSEALGILLRKVCEYSGWSCAQSWLPDESRDRLELGPAWHSRIAGLEGFRKANERVAFAPPHGALERVWRERKPDWVWDLQPAAQAVRRPLMIEAGLRSWTGFPVLAGDEVIAVIEFFDKELRSRDERVLRLIAILATQIGPVIQRKRAGERIDALNASLKRYTAELESTNKELEGFSYSVSHDLRAPLRAVDGYARMLEEDHAGRLDAEGRRLLGVVRSSSRQMGQLIDDLLAFSRLGRQEPAKRRIDMASLVREVLGELARDAAAVIEVSALPSAQADRALLRQVWVNLIGNALKYSARRDPPRVEIAGREEAGEALYWVRDNGVGFDMRYAGKLFGVFQRLHAADEFPGTGVGLAIVQRVIARHGGRVWAQAKEGEGACFYFSLPRMG